MTARSQARSKAIRVLTAMIALISASASALSQDASQYDRGTPPQHAAGVSSPGSYMSADLGTINLGNGSLNFRLSIGNVGGRGFWLPLTLNYSSKLWSARKGTLHLDEPLPGGRDVRIAWATYSDGTEDFYHIAGPGWSAGAAPFLKARGVGISSVHNPNNGCTDYNTDGTTVLGATEQDWKPVHQHRSQHPKPARPPLAAIRLRWSDR